MKIVLASASPRRKELMETLGKDFEVIVSDVEEIITKSNPQEIVEELAYIKAMDVFGKLDGEVIVIGADTIVSKNGDILGKPKDKEDARRMLLLLSGSNHQVYTGVTILIQKENKFKKIIFSEKTEVHFYAISEEEIEWYLNTGESMDKAGAYGIQGVARKYIKKINGDYFNVVGFPIGRIYQALKDIL